MSQESSNAYSGLDMSAPYLQLLDIDEALANGMPVQTALDYFEQLESYLWKQYDRLDQQAGSSNSLMREGLLRLVHVAQGMADDVQADSPSNKSWLELAHRANQLLMQGVRGQES
ncbi:MAG: hypothetical protein U0931_35835 [Vulcanimicrobiota bacterium]